MDNADTTDCHSNTGAGSTSSPIDMESALERAMGDLAFLESMIQKFLEQMPAHLDEIKEALTNGDTEAVRQKAHALKGSAANLSATDIASAALHLEELGSAGALEKGEEILNLLLNEVNRLGEYVSDAAWSNMLTSK